MGEDNDLGFGLQRSGAAVEPYAHFAEGSGDVGELSHGQARSLSAAISSVLSRAAAMSMASSVLRACADVDEMLRVAVELARTEVGLERAAFYIRDLQDERVLLRGTWGTGAAGETVSEHALFHELSTQDTQRLLRTRAKHPPALCRPKTLQYGFESGRSTVLGVGWVMVTPLVIENQLIGVMYNDAALTGAPADPEKQVIASVLCSMVAIEHGMRIGPPPWKRIALRLKQDTLAARVKDLVTRNPGRSGKELAAEFGISAGFLAREFKREMGVSLVEYRNRLRLGRFEELSRERGPACSVKQAAFEAGFGSYAQFNRVHKQLTGRSATLREEASSSPADQPSSLATKTSNLSALGPQRPFALQIDHGSP